MAMISEIKCARCDRKYSGIRSRCPYCGELRIGRGKNAEDAENSRGKMLICVLILAVLTVGAAVLLLTTPEEVPDPGPAIDYQNGEEDNGPLEDPGTVSIPGPELPPPPEPEPDPPPPEPAPPAINSITVTHGGVPLRFVNEYSANVGDRLRFGVRIDPAAAADYAEIRWVPQNPNIVDIVAEDETGLTAMATHIARGYARWTVYVNDDLYFTVSVIVSP